MKTIFKNLFILVVATSISLQNQAQDLINTQPEAQAGDVAFAAQAIQGNSFEIEAAHIALQKTQNNAIKQYAEMMKTDHTQAGDELLTLIQNKNWDVQLPKQADYQDMLQQLADEAPETFDQLYIRIMGQTHAKTIDLFMQASENTTAQDSELVTYAKNKLPVFQKHLQDLKNIDITQDNQQKGENTPKIEQR